VLNTAVGLLDSVRHRYETEHQPETLREASRRFAELTAGRYTRVWTPIGQRELRVDDARGNSLAVDVLSRGTRELLFLGLRLALASSYARRGANVPLVLDDVLVNLDAQRAQTAAKALHEFSDSGHQILLFTCHEHTLPLFRELGVQVREIPRHADMATNAGRPSQGVSSARPAGARPQSDRKHQDAANRDAEETRKPKERNDKPENLERVAPGGHPRDDESAGGVFPFADRYEDETDDLYFELKRSGHLSGEPGAVSPNTPSRPSEYHSYVWDEDSDWAVDGPRETDAA
jgi:hypothetical protein